MSKNIESPLAKQIAHLTLESYEKLSNGGKPASNEWTTLASIVMEKLPEFDNVPESMECPSNDLQLICLATGTKLVTGKLALTPNLILDCHAESLCRRLLKRWLLDQFLVQELNLERKKFHMFISQLPCGTVNRYKGISIQRKKPGRGEQSNKATCVDKILKWNLMGLQGRCLYPMTKQPIRLHSIVIGSCETCVDETSQISELRQSLCLNDKEESPNKKRRSDSIDDSWNLEYCPKLERVADFRVDAFLRTDDRRACPNAIAYYKQVDGTFSSVILVNGRKQGVSLKNHAKVILKFSPLGIKKDICHLLHDDQKDLTTADSADRLVKDKHLQNYDRKWNQLLLEFENFYKWRKVVRDNK